MKELILLVIVLLGLGFFLGRATASKTEYTLKPYSGLGSGVLAPGTVLKENYKDPASILGNAEGGVWVLEEVK